MCLGKLRIASVSWSSTGDKGDNKCYKAIQLLPSRQDISRFVTEHEAQRACHPVVNEVVELLSSFSVRDCQTKLEANNENN